MGHGAQCGVMMRQGPEGEEMVKSPPATFPSSSGRSIQPSQESRQVFCEKMGNPRPLYTDIWDSPRGKTRGLTWDYPTAEPRGGQSCFFPVLNLALKSSQVNGSQTGVSTLNLSPELWFQTQHHLERSMDNSNLTCSKHNTGLPPPNLFLLQFHHLRNEKINSTSFSS